MTTKKKKAVKPLHHNYASSFCFDLQFMLKYGWSIRHFKIAGSPPDPNRLEFVRPDKIALKCWRETCKRLKMADCEKHIKESQAEGGFVERVEITGVSKWHIQRMIVHGLIDSDYKPTALGRKVWRSLEKELAK